ASLVDGGHEIPQPQVVLILKPDQQRVERRGTRCGCHTSSFALALAQFFQPLSKHAAERLQPCEFGGDPVQMGFQFDRREAGKIFWCRVGDAPARYAGEQVAQADGAKVFWSRIRKATTVATNQVK